MVDPIRVIAYHAERESLKSIISEMIDKGYSVEEQRLVMERGLRELRRHGL